MKVIKNTIPLVVCAVSAFLALSVHAADAFTVIDARNYPRLPKAYNGAELRSDYAKTRQLDVAFHGPSSSVNIRVKQGEIPGDVALWGKSGVTLVLDCESTDALPDKLKAEVTALDWSVTPRQKAQVETEEIRPRDVVRRSGKTMRLVLPFKAQNLEVGRFAAEAIRLTASGEGVLVVTKAVVTGPGVVTDRQGTKAKGSEEHLWLRVKGRHIVTSPLAPGGERPFVAAGVGYGKNVILRGNDELVAAYCKKMGLNTIRLAFYNQYFNSRANEPLTFEDVVGFIDPVLEAARRHGLYVILDDHAYFKNEIDEVNARGEQKSAGWTKARFEDWVACWGRVAEYYKDEPRILGYELCNEPVCEPEVARKWYKRAIDEVRKHDRRHIIIVGAHHWSHSRSLEATWKDVANKIDAPYGNVVFAFHDYPLDDDPWKVQKVLAAFQDKYEVPVMCTEFGNGGTPERVHRECQAGMLALFAKEGISWMIWALQDRPDLATGFPTRAKKVDRKWVQVDSPNPRYWIPYPEIWAPVAKIVASPVPEGR